MGLLGVLSLLSALKYFLGTPAPCWYQVVNLQSVSGKIPAFPGRTLFLKRNTSLLWSDSSLLGLSLLCGWFRRLARFKPQAVGQTFEFDADNLTNPILI